jgi:hypothetical protein
MSSVSAQVSKSAVEVEERFVMAGDIRGGPSRAGPS